MKIIRYQNSPLFSPVRNFTTLGDELDRLFDAAFLAPSSLQRQNSLGNGLGEFPIDLYQDKDSFFLRAELPGFRKEDLDVEVADGLLTVTGHRRNETGAPDKKEEGAATPEYRVSRTISLPEQVKVDQIQAEYQNGVLTVTLPKQEEVKPRQIAIKVK
jgi:HSP20 family protein